MRSKVVIETMERRVLLAATAPTKLAALPDFGVAQGGIVVDATGDIFGVTQATSNVFGTMYELPAGTTQIQTIRTSIEAQGAGPAPNLLIDPNGNIFGDMPTGGLSRNGVIFEIPYSPLGQQNMIALASYGGNDGAQLGNGVVRDVAGDLFVLAVPGSSTGTTGTTATAGAILELPANGSALQTLATFPASVNPVGRLAIDASGDLFAATQSGGINNFGAIYELPAGSSNLQLDASFSSTAPTPQGDLIADARGDVFGTTFNGVTTGSSLSTVFAASAGNSVPEILMTDANITGSHIQPGLVRDSDGSLYGAIDNTQSASTIFKIPHGKSFGDSTTIAAIPQIQSNGTNANEANGYLALDSAGNLFGTSILTATPQKNQSDTIFEIPDAASPAVASQIQITTQPSTTVIAPTEISPALTVDLLDSNNNLAATASNSITVQLKSGPAGATLGGTTTVSAIDGVATFSDLSINQAGTYTLRFTGTGLSSATSKSFKITPSPLDGSHLVISRVASVIAGSKIAPITVTAETSSNTVSTTTKGKVTLSFATSARSVNNTTVATKTASMKNGVAVFKNISIKQSGSFSIEASNSASTAGNASIGIIPATAKKLVFSQQPPNSNAGSTFSVQLQLLDKFGNLAADNSSIVLSLVGGPADAVLGGTITKSASGGQADFSDLSIMDPGSYKISAVDQIDSLKTTSKSFKISAVKS